MRNRKIKRANQTLAYKEIKTQIRTDANFRAAYNNFKAELFERTGVVLKDKDLMLEMSRNV